MFIELTDHLRCPADHDEAYLVLLPGQVEARMVVTGHLGCPVCGRTFQVMAGELDVGGAAPGEPAPSVMDASAMVALAGIQGPGGYLVMVGGTAAVWRELMTLNPGVGLVAVNPGSALVDATSVSVVRGGMIPLKANTTRGVILGPGYGNDPHWVREAARVTLPGLRIVGEGADPQDWIDIMASADGVWVGTKRR